MNLANIEIVIKNMMNKLKDQFPIGTSSIPAHICESVDQVSDTNIELIKSDYWISADFRKVSNLCTINKLRRINSDHISLTLSGRYILQLEHNQPADLIR